jgi:hypothetical protein
VLFVGPHQPYLSYVADVLPSLGEEGVQICTLRNLVAEGAAAAVESDPAVARLKSSARLLEAIEPAARFYEEPPTTGIRVETPWSAIWLSADDWAEAFETPDPGTPHNEARDQIWDALLAILMDKNDDGEDVSAHQFRKALLQNRELLATFNRAWPLIEAADLVGTCGRCPPTCGVRSLAQPDEVGAAARGRPGLDGVRPAAAGRGAAAARRPGGVPAPAPQEAASPPSASRWPRSSTT